MTVVVRILAVLLDGLMLVAGAAQSAGAIWEAAERYRGALHGGNGSNLTVVLRPNLIF